MRASIPLVRAPVRRVGIQLVQDIDHSKATVHWHHVENDGKPIVSVVGGPSGCEVPQDEIPKAENAGQAQAYRKLRGVVFDL
mmetsp:Transcript_19383/g.48615  ORF Transcript_19383/g.48615 Transcript_19383/m.48615 type:complete len:82 (+) Transcript_19383:70-315(+)